MSKTDSYNPLTASDSEEKDENIANNSKDDAPEYEWGKHPNTIKNIKKYQYPKGVSGNVLGRRPTFDKLAKQLQELGLEETLNWNKTKSKGTRKNQVLERIWTDAIGGDMKKIQLLAWLGCLD